MDGSASRMDSGTAKKPPPVDVSSPFIKRSLSWSVSDVGDLPPSSPPRAAIGRPLATNIWHGRSYGLSLDRCDDENVTTISFRLSASEASLVGMGLQWVPLTEPPSPRRSHDTDPKVHRAIHVRFQGRIWDRGRTSRLTACTVLFWLISSVGAAFVASMMLPTLTDHLKLGANEPPTHHRAAVMSRSAALWVDEPPAFGEHLDIDQLRDSLVRLRMQTSPLSSVPECLSVPNEVPNLPIAAVGLARALVSVLTGVGSSQDSSQDASSGSSQGLSPDSSQGPSPDYSRERPDGRMGHHGPSCESSARGPAPCTLHPARGPARGASSIDEAPTTASVTAAGGVDVERSLLAARLSGMTYASVACAACATRTASMPMSTAAG